MTTHVERLKTQLAAEQTARMHFEQEYKAAVRNNAALSAECERLLLLVDASAEVERQLQQNADVERIRADGLAARLAELEAPAQSLAVPEECPHMIVFDDADRMPLMFAGAGAREAALKTWKKISVSWNAHLFVRVERNSRDDKYPSAQLAQHTEAERDWAASLSLWAKGKFSPASGRYIGQICGNTDWALAQVVWSAAMEYRINATQEGE